MALLSHLVLSQFPEGASPQRRGSRSSPTQQEVADVFSLPHSPSQLWEGAASPSCLCPARSGGALAGREAPTGGQHGHCMPGVLCGPLMLGVDALFALSR